MTFSSDRWNGPPLAQPPPRHSGQGVTDADRAFLRWDNPELVDLRRRYAITKQTFGLPMLWHDGHIQPEDVLFFRGDNAYVWQHKDKNLREHYLLTYFYLKDIARDLFDDLREDNAFGIFTFSVGEHDRIVSRDLLDSINEILFLKRMGLAKPDAEILDIGAGYGRLAARFSAAIQGAHYWCIDAVPCSTFLCRFYLRRRGVEHRASTIAFDRQDLLPGGGQIKLAVNIHSFSECSAKAIDYWIKRCAELAIEYLFIVPNGSAHGGEPRRNDGTEFASIVNAHGYVLQHAEPKYGNPEVQRLGVSPAWYYLFRRQGLT